MTAISYHASIKDVQAEPLATTGPFARREWFERLEAAQPGSVYAVAEDISGAVALPLLRNGRRLEALLNWYAFTWRPLATPHGSLDSLLIALARALATQTSHIVLDRLPDEDAMVGVPDQGAFGQPGEDLAQTAEAIGLRLQFVGVIHQPGTGSTLQQHAERQGGDTVAVDAPDFVVAVAPVHCAAPATGALQLADQSALAALSDAHDPDTAV